MRCPGALHGTGSAPGAPGTPENTTGAPGSMPIVAQVPGWKLGLVMSKGAAALVMCASCSLLDVEHACSLTTWRIEAQGPNYPWLGPGLHQWRTLPGLFPDELTPLQPENGLPY